MTPPSDIGKVVQIATDQGDLFALTEDGDIFIWVPESWSWDEIPSPNGLMKLGRTQ